MDYLSKRLTGWLNLSARGRGRRFADAVRRLTIFHGQVNAERPDAIVFSGDASAVGLGAETMSAADGLGVGDASMPGVAVPGNHDHYVGGDPLRGDFERAFAPWQKGWRVDEHTYPFAREINGAWLVGVNSAVPNSLFWDARGRVGRPQLARLGRLLESLPTGPRVLITHYPPCCEDGSPEPFWHGLRDVESLKQIMADNGVVAWLCGHRHHGYVLPPDASRPYTVCCAGSGTQNGLASFCEVRIDVDSVEVTRRKFVPTADHFRTAPEA